MRAAVFHAPYDIRIEDHVADPIARPGEVILRVTGAGVCGTDAKEYTSGPVFFPLHVRHPVTGHLGPIIPGHEVAGVVVELGDDVEGFAVGDAVVTGGAASCLTCHWCLVGMTNNCERYQTVGLQRDGGLAELVAVPAMSCISIEPYDLTPDASALAQPMSIAAHVMRRGRLAKGEVAVIIGCGALGSFLTYATTAEGAIVVTTDIRQDRIDLARRLGAQFTALNEDSALRDTVVANGLVPSVIYEATGTPEGFRSALDVARLGTRIVVAGLQTKPTDLRLLDVTLGELELIGTNSHIFGTDLPRSLELLASREEGWSDIAPVILPLDDLIDEAIVPLAEHRSQRIKTLIDPAATIGRPTIT
jgi:(R,R)-butanediol dehydrogenase/meso-butanediol dehydrogenase/diacetyl reductase